METDKYRIFLQAVDAGSFSAVAEKFGYTPSGIVHMMNSLEERFGFALLIRSHKGIRLTPEGQRVVPILRNLVRWDEHLRQVCSEIQGAVEGDITIGSYYSIASCWLPGTIRRYQQDYPNVRLRIQEGVHQKLDELLSTQRVDFCLYSYPPVSGYQWIPLKKDRMVAVLPPGHRLSRGAAFPIRAFREEPFIMPADGCDYDIMKVFEKYDIEPQIAFSTGEDHAAISMVEHGLGISLLNELATSNHMTRAVRLPLEPEEYAVLGIAAPSLRRLSPAARMFVEYLKEDVRKL